MLFSFLHLEVIRILALFFVTLNLEVIQFNLIFLGQDNIGILFFDLERGTRNVYSPGLRFGTGIGNMYIFRDENKITGWGRYVPNLFCCHPYTLHPYKSFQRNKIFYYVVDSHFSCALLFYGKSHFLF